MLLQAILSNTLSLFRFLHMAKILNKTIFNNKPLDGRLKECKQLAYYNDALYLTRISQSAWLDVQKFKHGF